MLNEPIQFLVLLDQLKRFELFKMMAETAAEPAFFFKMLTSQSFFTITESSLKTVDAQPQPPD